MNRSYRSSRNPRRSSRDQRRSRRNEPSINLTPFLLIVVVMLGAYVLKGEEITAYTKDLLDKVKITSKEVMAEGTQSYAMPCMEANAAKIIAYTILDVSKLETKPDDQWYSKYYRALEGDSRFAFLSVENALNPITYAQTSDILTAILGEGYGVSLGGAEGSENKSITFEKFLEIYDTALTQAKDGIGLNYEEVSILSTPATNKSLEAWQVATNKGKYSFEGLIIDSFKDCTIKVAVKDNEMLGIVETVSNQSVINQCYITDVTEESVKVTIGQEEMTYINEAVDVSAKGSMATLTIKEGKVIGYELDQVKNTDRILRITDQYIEFEQGGRFPYESVEVYDTTDNANWKTLAQVSSGAEVQYVEKNGQVQAIQVISKDFEDKMRVLISEDGLGNYSHKDVVLESNDEYDVVYQGKNLLFQKGGVWTASKFNWQDDNKVTFVPKGNTQMQISSIKRQGNNPEYKGAIEVYKEEDGTFVVVNEVDMTNYLAGVIPSEMPTSYGIEAAKVQAIAARSYAVSHQTNSKFAKYGAQVDDTTASQVYNNIAADDTSYKAAKDTKDLVLMSNGNVISGNFFASSAGYTANYGEVWAQGEIFPTNTPVHLVSRQQYIGDRMVTDMSSEKDAYAFFTTEAKEVDAFDNGSPWFRWQVHYTAEEIAHVINSNVKRLTTQYPNLVKVLSEDKWQVGEVESVGNIEDIKVEDRGEGGNIMEMIIKGDEATVKVQTEYLIRCLFAPIQKDTSKDPIKVVRADGTTVENMNMLPSAFFSMDTVYGKDQKVKELTLYGGGFGHGVGMSQDGVKGMVSRGYTYKQILEHYYQGVEISSYR